MLKRRVTPALRAANARRKLTTGKHAKTLTPAEIRRTLIERIHPGAVEIMDNVFAIAARTGELTEVSKVGAQALMETELLRRAAVQTIAADGVTVKDHLMDRSGKVYGHRLKAHPLIEHVTKMAEQLGFTAEELQLTAKARGQGQKDAAMTAVLERMAKLRSVDKDRMLPPAPAAAEKPAIETTATSR